MATLQFLMPGVCFVGCGALANLGPEVRRLGAGKALVICDPGIARAGLLERVTAILTAAGVEHDVFAAVELEPSTDNVAQAAAAARRGGYELLIGLGGGSSLDVAKGAAIVVANGGKIEDYFGIEQVPGPGLPTVLIPTTAGTGAEVTLNAIFAVPAEGTKKGVVSRCLRPAVALVDPELTLTCPPRVTAAAGMDALVHAVEAFTALKATPHTDLYALEAIRRIGRGLRGAVWNGGLEARTDMAWGSFLAGVALANAGVGAVHALAYPLGGRFHLSHGVANALLFLYVLPYNLPGNLPKFALVAGALGEPVGDKSPTAAAQAALGAIAGLARDVGIPRSLQEFGVTAADLEGLADSAWAQTRLLGNNPRALTQDDILRIYQAALAGGGPA